MAAYLAGHGPGPAGGRIVKMHLSMKVLNALKARFGAGPLAGSDDDTFIAQVYRGLLGRDPDQAGRSYFGQRLRERTLDRVGLIQALVTSPEFKSAAGGSPQSRQNEPRGCSRSEAETLFAKFKRFEGPGRPGFVTNFLGGLTDVRFVGGLESLSGVVEGYPIPGNFHGDTLEWVGTLHSVLEATGSFTMLELGAGWGPWCVIGFLAAQQLGIKKVRLVGVEGDLGHVGFMRDTFAVNGIDADCGTALHGIVGVRDGKAFFPTARDPSLDYGAMAAVSEEGIDPDRDLPAARAKRPEDMDITPCFSLATLLRDFDYVDLIHCDIQGSEAELFTGTLELVSQKVKRIVIGTHSFAIDRQLACLFPGAGWQLEGIDVCVMAGGQAVHDGAQIWRNTRL